MMIWEMTHNGAHGLTTLRFRVPDGSGVGDIVEVSDRVARRLNDAVCGCSGCTCYEAVAYADGPVDAGPWYVELREEVRGRYPQS